MFCEIMDQITNDYTALYIHNATTSNNLEDIVFYFKAKPIPDDNWISNGEPIREPQSRPSPRAAASGPEQTPGVSEGTPFATLRRSAWGYSVSGGMGVNKLTFRGGAFLKYVIGFAFKGKRSLGSQGSANR